ncbi:hypothetical protein QBC40DRAFT_325645 [Triangularia verruculosa]|uniref:Alpha/beta-hydrolase n=1 Tax=Triangularia verruculosa TaxID=2587418 RepID=A0AAN7B089_9PEZI|nr:hypothetical protein QBC40DRAFT_325645 [Triangularia verruculosa]
MTKLYQSVLVLFLPLLGLGLEAPDPWAFTHSNKEKAIVLANTGGFNIGSKIVSDPRRPGQTITCDHGYFEYFIPLHSPPTHLRRKTSLVLWHSSSTQTFQNRWDGGPGFKDLLLRHGYPVYLFEAPRLGRANWACKPHRYDVTYRDHDNFFAWNFGPSFPDWWPGLQWPTDPAVREASWEQATGGRYVEFDDYEHILLHAEVAAQGAVHTEKGEERDGVVYLTSSAAGLRALLTATLSDETVGKIRGIVAYESAGYVFPEGHNITERRDQPFGPLVVTQEAWKRLAKLDFVQFVWGDNREGKGGFWEEMLGQSKECARLINEYGGRAEVVRLKEDLGIVGNTHCPFTDMNNEVILGLLEERLEKSGLDGYEGRKGKGKGKNKGRRSV